MTRAVIPESANVVAASRHSCNVTPAPIKVTSSASLLRITLAPPMGKPSSVR